MMPDAAIQIYFDIALAIAPPSPVRGDPGREWFTHTNPMGFGMPKQQIADRDKEIHEEMGGNDEWKGEVSQAPGRTGKVEHGR